MEKIQVAIIFGLMLLANYALMRLELWSEGKSYISSYKRSNGTYVKPYGRSERSLW